MKTVRLLTDIIKAAEKRDLYKKSFPFKYGEMDDLIAILIDDYYIVFVRKDEFYLDLSKVFKKQEPLNIEKIVKGYEYALPAIDTGVTRVLDNKKTVRVFSTDKDDIWIDQKNLKYFDLDQVYFKGTVKKCPLYIFDKDLDILLGVILPVNHI